MYNIILNIIINLVLVVLLVLSSIEDIRNKLIPNKYTIPALLFGFVLMTMNNGLDGLKDSFLGFLLGFLIFFLPFVLGFIGAGDVKLLAAIGALKGFTFTIYALLASSVVGGIMVIIYAIYKKKMLNTFINMFGIIIRPLAKIVYLNSSNKIAKKVFDYFETKKQEDINLYIPYAMPISVGTIGILVSSIFNLL